MMFWNIPYAIFNYNFLCKIRKSLQGVYRSTIQLIHNYLVDVGIIFPPITPFIILFMIINWTPDTKETGLDARRQGWLKGFLSL